MKKLLGIIGSFGLTATFASTVAACSPTQGEIRDKNNISIIGKNIDKSKAIDSSKKGNYNVSNFFIIGDSLSDSHGLENLVKDSFGIDLKMTGEYSKAGSFTNDYTAGVYLAQKLGFAATGTSETNPNPLSVGEINKYGDLAGKNYSVGGAMAADAIGTTGMLLNKVNILNQSRALIAQHKIKDTDVVFMEIGGNDLFAMVDNNKDPNLTFTIMKQAVERVRETFYTLLNNGVKRIIWSEPPNVGQVPKYINGNLESVADSISKEFIFRLRKVENEVKEKFKNEIKDYSFFSNLPKLMDKFKNEIGEKAIVDKASHSSAGFDLTEVIETKQITAKFINGANKENLKNYFFFDDVHPNEYAHKQVADELLKLIKEW